MIFLSKLLIFVSLLPLNACGGAETKMNTEKQLKINAINIIILIILHNIVWKYINYGKILSIYVHIYTNRRWEIYLHLNWVKKLYLPFINHVVASFFCTDVECANNIVKRDGRRATIFALFPLFLFTFLFFSAFYYFMR